MVPYNLEYFHHIEFIKIVVVVWAPYLHADGREGTGR
jgi:hypothetical protein